MLVIDEMSMLTGKMLRDIDHRMQSVRENTTVPFGGMCVMLMGDFVQIPPIGGGDLCMEPKTTHTAWGLDGLEGHKLFKKFTLINLTGQLRAKDAQHMRAVAAFRKQSSMQEVMVF